MKTYQVIVLAYMLCMPVAYASSIAATANLEPRTHGGAIHLSIPLAPTLDVRIGFNNYLYHNALKISGGSSEQRDDVTYGVKRKVDNYDVLLDWFPFNNYFRLTSGVVLTNITTITLAKADIDHNNTSASTALVSRIRNNTDLAPYLGFGLGLPDGRSYKRGLSVDIGILFQRPASLQFVHSYCTIANATCQQLHAAIAQQKQQIEHYFDRHRYVMARVGLTYRF